MVELAQMSYREMVARGKELGMEGCHKMKKEALLERLRELGATDGGQVSAPAEGARKYSFPSPVKCPRCGATDTEAYSTKGRIQYRRCRRAVCRRNFTVQGEQLRAATSKPGE